MIKSISLYQVDYIEVFFLGDKFSNDIHFNRIGGGWSVMPIVEVKNAKIVRHAGTK